MDARRRGFRTGQLARDRGVSVATAQEWIDSFESESEGVLRILVADDNARVVESLLDTLRAILPDSKLEAATDGHEGLLKVGTFRPHLLLLDIRLPGLDGFQVCQRVKADPATRSTKIVGITGSPESDVRGRSLEAGADGFLQKPFQIAQLTAELARLLGATRRDAGG